MSNLPPSPLSDHDAVEMELFGERLVLTADLLNKYSTHGPRYTSYPTAPMWKEAFGPEAFKEALKATNGADAKATPLSLYAHIPFCESRCLFCGCNVVITRNKESAEKYLDYLFREIDQIAPLIHPERQVMQFHWGGGTPTYLSPEQMVRLFNYQKERFQLSAQSEIAIEVDPRVTTDEQLQVLRELGFNRVSLGVQDVDATVQEAINRIQPMDMTARMVSQCRTLGFESLNLDLIYGLPHQTQASFEHTVDAIIDMSPDRIALYHYAHVPWIAPHQSHMPEDALPGTPEKIRIFMRAMQKLTEAGYVYIGMDHFAKPGDELAVAQRQGSLHRNFMGYTTRAGSDLVAFGVSSISGLNGFYAQNQRKLTDYYDAVDTGTLATMRGYALNEDDLLRRHIIMQLLCHGHLNFAEVEARFALPSFRTYFDKALSQLDGFVADGLAHVSEEAILLTPLGRILSRNLAMRFDAYLPENQATPLFSKTI